MLEISAIISLALSFYQPPEEEESELGSFSTFYLFLFANNFKQLNADAQNYEENRENQYGFIESLAILVSIVIIVLVSVVNDYSKEKQFRGMAEHNFDRQSYI